MALNLLPHSVAVVTMGDGADDAYGNPVRGEVGRVTESARLWQLSSTEATVGRDTATDAWAGIFTASSVISTGGRVEWDGRLFEVDGSPDPVYASTSLHHVEARLRYSGPVT